MNFKHLNRQLASPFPALSDHEQYAVVFALKESIERKIAELKQLHGSGLERTATLYTILGNGLIEICEAGGVLDKICPDTLGFPTVEFRVSNTVLTEAQLTGMVKEIADTELKHGEGFVTQLWADGAITYCKSGVDPQYSTVHVLQKGLPGFGRFRAFFEETADDGRGFIYCKGEDAMTVRMKMIDALIDSL